ncbi:transcription antitermination factor NusB [Candidatus Marinamargulisbacteria bacterium SCGC AG-343-D04]|nr:transcription antitermination factor NusB [Candidatus Marinamargulisbacteria bacterium SCGC AG-343-D04]
MGFRHSGRKFAMQVLYQAINGSASFEDSLESYLNESHFDQKALDFGRVLAINSWENKEDSDALISQYAIGWTLDRISLVDLSILRLAFYELTSKETPFNVVVDEAVELSKEFSAEESSRFVNGILGKYVKECLQES